MTAWVASCPSASLPLVATTCPRTLATPATNRVWKRRPEAPPGRPPEVTRQRPLLSCSSLPQPPPPPPPPPPRPPRLSTSLPHILPCLPIGGAPHIVLLKTLISAPPSKSHNRRHIQRQLTLLRLSKSIISLVRAF